MKRNDAFKKFGIFAAGATIALSFNAFVPQQANALFYGQNAASNDPMAQATVQVGGFCTGVAIAPHWILSAGHCFGWKSSPDHELSTSYKLALATGIDRKIFPASPDDDDSSAPSVLPTGMTAYYFPGAKDVVLIHSDKDLGLPVYAGIPDEGFVPAPGSKATNYGWGTGTGNRLQKAEDSLAPQKVSDAHGIDEFIGLHQNGEHTGGGDSGGPLIQDGKVIGIVHDFISEYPYKELPGVIQYGAVANISQSIKAKMATYNDSNGTLWIAGYHNAQVVAGEQFSLTPYLSKSSVQLSQTGLPDGLKFDPSTGAITGAPTGSELGDQPAKEFPVKITVPGGKDINFTITVSKNPKQSKLNVDQEKGFLQNENTVQPYKLTIQQGGTSKDLPSFVPLTRSQKQSVPVRFITRPNSAKALPAGFILNPNTGALTVPENAEIKTYSFEEVVYFEDGSYSNVPVTVTVTKKEDVQPPATAIPTYAPTVPETDPLGIGKAIVPPATEDPKPELGAGKAIVPPATEEPKPELGIGKAIVPPATEEAKPELGIGKAIVPPATEEPKPELGIGKAIVPPATEEAKPELGIGKAIVPPATEDPKPELGAGKAIVPPATEDPKPELGAGKAIVPPATEDAKPELGAGKAIVPPATEDAKPELGAGKAIVPPATEDAKPELGAGKAIVPPATEEAKPELGAGKTIVPPATEDAKPELGIGKAIVPPAAEEAKPELGAGKALVPPATEEPKPELGIGKAIVPPATEDAKPELGAGKVSAPTETAQNVPAKSESVFSQQKDIQPATTAQAKPATQPDKTVQPSTADRPKTAESTLPHTGTNVVPVGLLAISLMALGAVLIRKRKSL